VSLAVYALKIVLVVIGWVVGGMRRRGRRSLRETLVALASDDGDWTSIRLRVIRRLLLWRLRSIVWLVSRCLRGGIARRVCARRRRWRLCALRIARLCSILLLEASACVCAGGGLWVEHIAIFIGLNVLARIVCRYGLLVLWLLLLLLLLV
jgi:hypothetical protein